MTVFEKEMRHFFKNDKLIENKVFIGKVLTAKLNETTNIKVFWDTQIVADNYLGFTIKIINKANGVIDTIYVKISDIIGLIDFGDRKIHHYIWENRGDVGWYGPEPTEQQIQKVMNVISDYIMLYK